MDLLQQLVQQMTKEEVKQFKLFAQRAVSLNFRRDIDLFDAMRKQKKSVITSAGKRKENAQYRLKNRVFSYVSKSIFIQHFERHHELKILYYLGLYRLNFEKRQFQLARYYLMRAEKNSLQHAHYDTLDIIYSEFIKLYNDDFTGDPHAYIRKQQQNFILLQKLRELEALLASLSFKIRVTQDYTPLEKKELILLERRMTDFMKDKSFRKETLLRLNVAEGYARLLLQKNDFTRLAQFAQQQYRQFENEKIFQRQFHRHKLYFLTLICNALFYLNRHTESLQYAQKLYEGMMEHGAFLFHKYSAFYYNSQVINYSVLNPDKAIELLEKLKQDKRARTYYEFYLYLNLAILYYQKNKLAQSVQHFVRAVLFDEFHQAERLFQLKVLIAELMLRMNLQEAGFVLKRVSVLRKKYASVLSARNALREKRMLRLLEVLCERSVQRQKAHALKKSITQEMPVGREILNYEKWIAEYGI